MVPDVEKWRGFRGGGFTGVVSGDWAQWSLSSRVIFTLLIWGKCRYRITGRLRQKAWSDWGKKTMQWTAPTFEEVCLNCEINSYVSAKL
jgi:coenzyme PQQ precursor peptide PqqA